MAEESQNLRAQRFITDQQTQTNNIMSLIHTLSIRYYQL